MHCSQNKAQSKVLFYLRAVSGLKINFDKLELLPVGIVDDVGGLASILGCRVSSPATKYLGLPLGASFKAKSIWDGIIEKDGTLLGWLEAALFS